MTFSKTPLSKLKNGKGVLGYYSIVNLKICSQFLKCGIFVFMTTEQNTIRFHTLDELGQVAHELMALGRGTPIWLFEGEMGAGKTTIIKALCAYLGVEATVTSPTFALVNEYLTEDKRLVYHFDFYRITHETEALDIGIEEYFDSGYFCFIEWPSLIESLWPNDYLMIKIAVMEDGERIITVNQIN
tara:strand:- start:560 stop:1117 length:558 start_codon:yes stop_codon:yes gene_type:complete